MTRSVAAGVGWRLRLPLSLLLLVGAALGSAAPAAADSATVTFTFVPPHAGQAVPYLTASPANVTIFEGDSVTFVNTTIFPMDMGGCGGTAEPLGDVSKSFDQSQTCFASVALQVPISYTVSSGPAAGQTFTVTKAEGFASISVVKKPVDLTDVIPVAGDSAPEPDPLSFGPAQALPPDPNHNGTCKDVEVRGDGLDHAFELHADGLPNNYDAANVTAQVLDAASGPVGPAYSMAGHNNGVRAWGPGDDFTLARGHLYYVHLCNWSAMGVTLTPGVRTAKTGQSLPPEVRSMPPAPPALAGAGGGSGSLLPLSSPSIVAPGVPTCSGGTILLGSASVSGCFAAGTTLAGTISPLFETTTFPCPAGFEGVHGGGGSTCWIAAAAVPSGWALGL